MKRKHILLSYNDASSSKQSCIFESMIILLLLNAPLPPSPYRKLSLVLILIHTMPLVLCFVLRQFVYA